MQYLPEWFPGTGFLQDAKEFHQLVMESIVKPHQYVVEQMVSDSLGFFAQCNVSHVAQGGGYSDSVLFVHTPGRRGEPRGGRSHNVDFDDGLSWYV